MDKVFVIRHKVLVEHRSIRSVAREMGVIRNTVAKYLEISAPVRKETAPLLRFCRYLQSYTYGME